MSSFSKFKRFSLDRSITNSIIGGYQYCQWAGGPGIRCDGGECYLGWFEGQAGGMCIFCSLGGHTCG